MGKDVEAPTELIAKPDVVMLDVPPGPRENVLRAMHAELGKAKGVTDSVRLLWDVLARVMAAPVCIAEDVALPHARTYAVNRIVIAVARMAEPGVEFDPEHPHVRLVFMIGTPKQQVENYLRVVAALTRLLRTPGVRAGLLGAKTEEEFRQILARGATA